jgi:P-type Ca2+ transporter type 2C
MYYQKSTAAVLEEFKSNGARGLTFREAAKRLSAFGPNILPQAVKPPIIFKLFDQFKNVLIFILLCAAAVSFFLGDALDAAAILSIVLLNAAIGFVQEVQAEKTLESLKEKEIRYAMVLREGSVEQIDAREIVPGDILVLEEGTKVSADCRLLESFSLRVDESILTGESLPAGKYPDIITKKVDLADQKNLLFKDTQIVSGRAKAVVYAAGKFTEIGKIATALTKEDEIKTPLTQQLDTVGHTLTLVIGIICVTLFFINFLKSVPFVDSLLIAISLAVAAIPEGLPAVVTVVLSLGVKRLADKKTIIKKLPSVETLGAIRIIATDKTGTITQNKISVKKIFLPDGNMFFVNGIGYKKEGEFLNANRRIINPHTFTKLELLLTIGVLANNATVHFEDNQNDSEVIGDTTEASLLVAAKRAHLNIAEMQQTNKRIFEVPFTSERKMMSVVVQINNTGDHYLYTKGAPEIVLENCTLSKQQKQIYLSNAKQMAQEGLRSLAFARRRLTNGEVKRALEHQEMFETKLEYMGIVGMQDPLRPEVKEALQKAAIAGIKTIMITGDHKETAMAIAREAGILQINNFAMTDSQVSKYSTTVICEKIKAGASVFTRISPLNKLKIINSIKLQRYTHVATTGDGVNDAPALKASHIAIAMGRTGTDITREVADVIITDDNYATIIDAIKEGRIIYANLVKFIRYLISCNVSEVILIAGGVIFGVPAPLLPIQLLWINLVTDGFPALALGVDPPEKDIMKRPPRDLSVGILHKKRWIYMMVEGTIMGATTLLLFIFALIFLNYNHAQTMAFATLAFSQLIHAFNNRSTKKSLFEIGLWGNKPLIWAAGISILLQIFITQSLWGNIVFKTTALGLDDWTLVTLASLVPFLVVEVKKKLRRGILP